MLFRRKIERSCSYCRHGIKVDETTCLCTKKGLVALDGACRRFRYEPLKRVPKAMAPNDFSQYDEVDFSL